MRLGLCCKFFHEPIRFRITTATSLLKLKRDEALRKVSRLCLDNADALQRAVSYCAEHHIGAFRVNSQILPVKTHPQAGYDISELPDAQEIQARFTAAGVLARSHDIRLSFHPDQFIVLSSPKAEVVERAIADLEYHAEVAGWIDADVINIHAGGTYGDKQGALKRLSRNLALLSEQARQRITLENDDKSYSPSDLLPFCRSEGIPFVYDVHHHRCLPDGKSVEDTTHAALDTWNREPLFHISSPKNGWEGPQPSRHHNYIDIRDFPECWKALEITVDVEAKAKELAVLQLYYDLKKEKEREPNETTANITKTGARIGLGLSTAAQT
jgi:UV DNA damage endonuclease